MLKAIRATDPDCQVILMTGDATVDTAIEAVKARRARLPDQAARLRSPDGTARRPSAKSVERREPLLNAEAASPRELEFHGMIGRERGRCRSSSRTIRRLAPHARTVLITGETGTGKELVARALHARARAARKRFVTVNCAAVVETLFESELFGHVRGAFTGATDSQGRDCSSTRTAARCSSTRSASCRSTLQAKLLRALEHGEIQRVGALEPKQRRRARHRGDQSRPAARVADGRFRADLYYRLSVVELHLPPLRERATTSPT